MYFIWFIHIGRILWIFLYRLDVVLNGVIGLSWLWLVLSN